MQTITLTPENQHAYARAALTYRYGEEHHPITQTQVLSARRWEDEKSDLWNTFQRVQENLIKGGLNARSAQGKRRHTRANQGIDGDIKLNRALCVLAENMLQHVS
ncbi:DUF932 domain-containing protein [Buttiauxella sp.]|uniref:DUF932 domain-containing protein n=1 Tax=Buttiauxella sp. TaxID=1972222 RepID=UPI003C746D1C